MCPRLLEHPVHLAANLLVFFPLFLCSARSKKGVNSIINVFIVLQHGNLAQLYRLQNGRSNCHWQLKSGTEISSLAVLCVPLSAI